MVLLYGVVAWRCCMVLLYGVVVWCCCMVVLHGVVLLWCCCMVVLYGVAAWCCCMVVLHGGAALFETMTQMKHRFKWPLLVFLHLQSSNSRRTPPTPPRSFSNTQKS